MLEHFEVVTHTCSIAGKSADVALAIAFVSGAMAGSLVSAFVSRAHAHWSRPPRTPPTSPAMPMMRRYRRSERRRRLLTRQCAPTPQARLPIDDDALTRVYVKPESDKNTRTAAQIDEDKTLTMPGVTVDEVRRELDEHRSRR